ncbi:MAG: hypothetical protein ACYDDT_01345 [Sulfuricella sp.]
MQSILTINGGSSSIKFALYRVGEPLERRLYGKIDRIGLSGTNLTFNDPTGNQQSSRSIEAADHSSAANFLIDCSPGGMDCSTATRHSSTSSIRCSTSTPSG